MAAFVKVYIGGKSAQITIDGTVVEEDIALVVVGVNASGKTMYAKV